MNGDREPDDGTLSAVTLRRDGFFGWRVQSYRERSVLENLAHLTHVRGSSWEAAREMFNPINEGGTP